MIERLGSILFVVAVAVLAFIGGAMVMLAESFPHDYLRDAWRAGQALVQQQREASPYQSDQWRVARSEATGVTSYDPTATFDGYTLYTGAGDTAAHLIGMDGRVLHEWRRPFSAIWNASATFPKPEHDDLIFMDKARMLPNGDLIAIYVGAADTPWGYGMVKLDRESNLIWSYLAHTHHDFDIAPDGRIIALTNAFTDEQIEGLDKLDKPYLDDFLVVLSPDGKETQKVSLTKALMKSRFKDLTLAIPSYGLGDPLHTNSVQFIDAALAEKFPFGKEGDVLVSFRDMSAVAVVSLEKGEVTWAMRGPWLWQHQARLVPSGNLTLFDNLGGFRNDNSARVLEVEPKTGKVVWTYQGDDSNPLHSPLRSGAVVLPNDNVLITESDAGRVFEVTRKGRIVWNFVNPTRGGAQGEMIAVATGGQRIDPKTLDPDLHSLLETRKEASR